MSILGTLLGIPTQKLKKNEYDLVMLVDQHRMETYIEHVTRGSNIKSGRVDLESGRVYVDMPKDIKFK